MKKIDWYILKKFLSTFFFAIMLFTLISVVVDISEKTDNFVKSNLSFTQIIMQYYIGFIPYIIAFLFPLFVLLAVIFFTSKMAAKTEVIAILSSGVSFRRYLRAYYVGGAFLGLVLWWSNRIVVPKANIIRTDFQAKYVDNDANNPGVSQMTHIHFRVDSSTYAGMAFYDTLRKTGSQFFLYRLDKQNRMVYNLRSEGIAWVPAAKKWRLDNLVERSINGLNETVKQEVQRQVNYSFLPVELSNDFYVQDKLTTPQLEDYIARQKLRGAEGINTLEVERYRRDAFPVSVFLLTMIGALIASRKIRGGERHSPGAGHFYQRLLHHLQPVFHRFFHERPPAAFLGRLDTQYYLHLRGLETLCKGAQVGRTGLEGPGKAVQRLRKPLRKTIVVETLTSGFAYICG